MHRYITAEGVELIKKFEGFRSKPYLCSGGHLTIGYGHKLLPNERWDNITQEQGMEILKKDLILVEHSVLRYINVRLADGQFTALVSFTFNLGSAALQRSTLRQKVNYRLFYEAGQEFLKWIYIKGNKTRGLIRRRIIESNLFLNSS